MKCSTIRDELSQYVEGTLPGEAQAAIARHLASCPACRAEAEAYQQAEEALCSLSAVVPAPDLTADLRRRLSAAAPPRPLRWVWAGAALAAVATAATLLALRGSAPPAPPKAIVQQPSAAGTPRLAAPSSPPQLAVKPVTEEEGVPRPTAPPRPSLAVLHCSPQPPARVRRVRHDAPPQPAQEVALETKGADAVAVPRPETSPKATLSGVEGRDPSPGPSPTPDSRPPTPDGVVLLLAAPQPALPAVSCRVEVSLPDGSTSVREQIAAPDAAGEERVVRVTYQTTGPNVSPEWRPQ